MTNLRNQMNDNDFADSKDGLRVKVPTSVRDAAERHNAIDPQNAIVIRADNTMAMRGFVMTGAGLTVPKTASKDDIEHVTTTLVRFEKHIQVFIGDALNAADDLGYGDITQKAEEWGLDRQTLYNWKSTMKKFEISLREEILGLYPDAEPPGISHYTLIQNRDDKEELLEKIVAGGWSISRLREELKTNKPPTKTEFQIESEAAVSMVAKLVSNPPKRFTKKKRTEVEKNIHTLTLLIEQAKSLIEGRG